MEISGQFENVDFRPLAYRRHIAREETPHHTWKKLHDSYVHDEPGLLYCPLASS
jgi:hypothetical protein